QSHSHLAITTTPTAPLNRTGFAVSPNSSGGISSSHGAGFRSTPITPTPPSGPNPTRTSFTGFGSPLSPTPPSGTPLVSFTPPALTGGAIDQVLRCSACDMVQRK